MKWILSILYLALFATASVQSCSTSDWVACAGICASCAVPCIDPLDGICEVCLGDAFLQCVSCMFTTNDINALVTVQGSNNQSCSAMSWVQCTAQLEKCEVVCEADLKAVACTICLGPTLDKCVYCLPDVASPGLTHGSQLASCSPLDWIKCAAKVVECSATCVNNGITSQQCIGCFGGVYDRCVGCIKFNTAVKSRQDVALLECSASSWLRCAGAVAKCTSDCIDNGIMSPHCINCLGSSYDDCIKCMSSKDKAEVKKLAIAQANSMGLTKARSINWSVGNCHRHDEH